MLRPGCLDLGSRCAGQGAFVDRRAFAGNRRLVDAAFAGGHDPVHRQPLVGPHDNDVAKLNVFDAYLDRLAIASNERGVRGEVCQRLDGPRGTAHRIVLQRVSQAEQKKQKRPFGPGAEDGGAGSGDEHQEIDLELCVRDFLNCFFQCEEAAKDVSANEQEDGKPARDNAELGPQPSNDQ